LAGFTSSASEGSASLSLCRVVGLTDDEAITTAMLLGCEIRAHPTDIYAHQGWCVIRWPYRDAHAPRGYPSRAEGARAWLRHCGYQRLGE
jgi:hypothetical protein